MSRAFGEPLRGVVLEHGPGPGRAFAPFFALVAAQAWRGHSRCDCEHWTHECPACEALYMEENFIEDYVRAFGNDAWVEFCEGMTS